MAIVQFNVLVDFDASSQEVWNELIDWKGHEAWIPATRVELDGPDATNVGATFTAWTGIGRLSLEDRMRVTECAWSADTQAGSCTVEKLGPVLRGSAGFTVTPRTNGSQVDWVEDVTVPYLPQLLAPVAALIGAAGFKLGMRRLNRMLTKS